MGNIIYIPKPVNPCLISLPTGLIAYYDFNEASGTTLYDKIGSRNLSIVGDGISIQQAGVLGSSYLFPRDTSSWVYGANSPIADVTTGLCTVAIWVKVNSWLSQPQNDYFLCTDEVARYPGARFGTGPYASPIVHCGINAIAVTPGNTELNLNEWYLLTVRLDITQISGYCEFVAGVNNVFSLINEGTDTPYYAIASGGLYLGRADFANNFTFHDCNICALWVWDKLLSDCEITALWNNGNGVVL